MLSLNLRRGVRDCHQSCILRRLIVYSFEGFVEYSADWNGEVLSDHSGLHRRALAIKRNILSGEYWDSVKIKQRNALLLREIGS